jgi:uncharacterized protein with HEPN domain
MPDNSLVMDGLLNIEESLEHLVERTSWIEKVDDFVTSSTGVDMLDVAAIRLMAVGEEIKKIDKRTGGELLARYPQINWKGAMGLRDVIAHGYFHIDAEVVFDTLRNNVHPLLDTVKLMIAEMKE